MILNNYFKIIKHFNHIQFIINQIITYLYHTHYSHFLNFHVRIKLKYMI